MVGGVRGGERGQREAQGAPINASGMRRSRGHPLNKLLSEQKDKKSSGSFVLP